MIVARGLGRGNYSGTIVAAGLALAPPAEESAQHPARRARIGFVLADRPLKFSIHARGATVASLSALAEYPLTTRATGATVARVRGIAEHPAKIRATGQTTIHLAQISETVRDIRAACEATAQVTAHGEPVQVFSDDELMALAAWTCLH